MSLKYLSYHLDLHEDKWNKLITSSKANELKPVDVSGKIDDYLTYTRDHAVNNSSYQYQTLKELARQNEQLNMFSISDLFH